MSDGTQQKKDYEFTMLIGVDGKPIARVVNDLIILERKENTMKEFTKKDLQNGDVVKLRDGQIGIVLITDDRLNTIIFPDTSYYLSDYEDDLTRPSKFHELCSADIMAVRRPPNSINNFFKAFDYSIGKLVYERKEVEEMTLEEVCKALGKEIKIVKNK